MNRRYQVAITGIDGLTSYLLLVLMMWFASGIVASSAWIDGLGLIVPVALAGMATTIMLARFAPRETTYWLAVELCGVVAVFIATADHHSVNPYADFTSWVLAARRSLALALMICVAGAAWLASAWTAYWILRRRNLYFGLLPMAAIIGTNVFNDPGQEGEPLKVAIWIALAVALAAWLNLARLRARWVHVADVGWSVRLRGARSLVLLLGIAFLLPPLQSQDLSGRLFPSTGKAQTGGTGGTQGSGGAPPVQTGYVESVRPGGTIRRSNDLVMQVTVDPGARVYWRGIDLYQVQRGAWTAGNGSAAVGNFAGGQPLYDDNLLNRRQVVHGQVQVLRAGQNTVFWPGEPLSTSVDVSASGGFATGGGIQTAYSRGALLPGQTYNVVASVSTATEDGLRAAGTVYPDSVSRSLVTAGEVIDPRIGSLAHAVTGGQPNTYDRVKAIEAYLRTRMTYRLNVATPPPGSDPVTFFLFDSRTGYCEYFASAMGEMVRSLGIPVRLVNGYGPGLVSTASHGIVEPAPTGVISSADAHTWVEVYFPAYGWIPFEPTPDPLYPTLGRGPIASLRPAPVPAVASHAPLSTRPALRRQVAPQPVGLWVAVGVLIAAVVAIAALALAIRGPARPRDPSASWRRLAWVGRRVGVTRLPSETPLEFAARLGRALPVLAIDISQIGSGYSRHCYRQGGLGADAENSFASSWTRLRRSLLPLLLRGAPAAG
jgi:hypothetical protein